MLCTFRLQELQQQMVGGEAASNQEMKEKRKNKIKFAENRKAKLAGKYCNDISCIHSSSTCINIYIFFPESPHVVSLFSFLLFPVITSVLLVLNIILE